MALLALMVISPFAAAAQKAAASTAPSTAVLSTPSATAAPKPVAGQIPKLWQSESSKHEFRVDLTNDLFRAEWVNIPPTAARQGAYIRTECRRTGSKWVGTSKVNMLFAVPDAPAGKDTKLCSITVRFEVESISAEKITGHSESLHSFDINTCRVQQTTWGPFTWVPKK
jgi:hypothetical protein